VNIRNSIIKKEDMIAKLKKRPQDGKADNEMRNLKKDLEKLNKIMESKMSTSNKGADYQKIENQIMDEMNI
jgi:hypothetical protein